MVESEIVYEENIIVLIGMVGSGKSYFGSLLAGWTAFTSTEKPDGGTKNISSTEVKLCENKFMLFDTPGIDDWDVP